MLHQYLMMLNAVFVGFVLICADTFDVGGISKYNDGSKLNKRSSSLRNLVGIIGRASREFN